MIAVSNLSMSYRRGTTATKVLEGVDLEIAAGECAFLAGPSGSGKTTLLSILGCILTPQQGSVNIFGADVSGLTNRGRAELRRDRIGFLFQRFHLIGGLTARENVVVPLTLQGVRPRAAARRADELLASVGLSDKVNSNPRNLSVGQCQRVALARALVANPDLILADEPTASLDAVSGVEIMKLIRNLTTDEGRTAVVVTHDARIFEFADRVLHLDSGRIVEETGGRGTDMKTEL